MTEFFLTVNRVSKFYGDVRAVDRASLEIGEGSTLVIQGASGSGKTTLLRLIAGLELPDDGEISINGEGANGPGRSLPPHMRKMGFVFQAPALWPHLTVADNILFGLAGRPRRENRQRMEELLERTGLAGLQKRYPDQLSGGQARRVSLARALAPEPSCLLMDEPLTNLDDDLKDKMLSLIKEELSRLGSAMIYVTHDSSEASALSKWVIFMERGRLTDHLPNR